MSFKISIVQFQPVIGDIRKNLQKHIEFTDRALEAGSSLIVFPELSLTGYTLRDLVPEMAITSDSPILDPLLERSEGISICLGAVEESKEYFFYNASFFLEAGEVINIYRKIYPPTYGIFDEKRFFAQGNLVRAFDSRLGRFGTLICNDARHPGLAYIYAMDGCNYLIIQGAVPARGFPTEDKPAPLKCFEDGNKFYASVFGIYTIFANLAGYEDGLLFGGNSMAAAPGGEIIKEAPLFEEAMITVEVSQENIRKYRISTPIMNEEDINISIDELMRIKNECRM
ncbi:MAG: hypothetical protein HQ591_05075 [candidate division Zixibacteria bacterium]|nr:hypothetical protein [Candidatus Tariuqbacter arcticus]